jgi:sodium-dependent dicarboxylate transporter 2/3/5
VSLRSRLSDPPTIRRAARFAGPVLAVLVYVLLPEAYAAEGARVAFSHAGRATTALAAWMALWWLTEAIEIPATALLPLVVLPLVGAGPIREVAAPYAHDLIFLFMGGFVLSMAMQRWELHRRIALVTLSIVGTNPPRIVAGFMIATAGLSMWLSNTATTIMMLPIALSVVAMVGDRQGGAIAEERHRLAVCLMLGIAYAASIGGVGTIIGSPPNLFLVSYIRESLGRDITFAQWMAMGLPLVLVFLPVTWWLLTRVLFPLPSRALGGADAIRAAHVALPPMSVAERTVTVVFGAAALAWIGRAWLTGVTVAGVRPLAGLTDSGIAMTAALSLFVLPSRSAGAGAVMRWRDLDAMPWGILVLFGGGLSLAAAIQANGVDAFLGRQAAAWQGIPSWLLIVLVTTLVIFLTELTSNTATAATFVPILGGIAPGLGVHPYLLIVPAALAASWAFMLPVATPPNAIVFGSGHVSVADMRRAGVRLNIAGIVILTGLTYFIALPLLGVPLA